MRKWLLLLSLLSVASFAAEIKNVEFSCGAKDCSLRFQFSSAKDLPNFFQKYDAASRQLTIGFSDTKSALGEGSFEMDPSSKSLQKLRVYTDASFKVPLLNFVFLTGTSVQSEKNPVSLSKGKDFVISLPKTKSASWSLRNLAKAASSVKKDESAKNAAPVKSVADKKAREDSLAQAKKAKADSVANAKKMAKSKAAADKKAREDSLAQAKKAKADSVANAKKMAKSKAAADKKAREDSLAQAKKAKADSIANAKKAKTDSIQEAKDLANKKVVSALIDGIKEMTGIQGNGIEQFRITTNAPVELSKVSGPDKASILMVSAAGPKKAPIFNVASSNIVKSVTWTSAGLRVQLFPNVHPSVLVYKGSLILQIPQAVKNAGFACYMAKPEGVYLRKWIDPVEKTESFDEFSKGMEADKKQIVSVAQSFGLRPVSRNLIVVAESTPFLSTPSEKGQELGRLSFGDHLEDIELEGLFYKVRQGSKIGYVNRRAVSFPDELSAVQSERLKQLAMEQGGTLDSSSVHFDHPIEERVSYSSFGRRDPFIEIKGLLEEGINIDQVELVGIIWESEVPMAILAESKNPSVSYTVKEGDRILNGKVLKITQTDVLFLLQEFGVSRRYSMSLPDQYGRNLK